MRLLILLPLLVLPGLSIAQEGRTKSRLLYSFENNTDVADLKRLSEEIDLIVVQDNGVTEGRNCARLTVPKGVGYGVFQLGTKSIQDWKDFDYFAVDVYSDDEHGYDINFELWDMDSKNYPTRFTQSLKTHKGRQTLFFPINRAKRNGKEGRDWSELEPKDKIDLNGLTRVKLFLTPLKDRNAVLWIDNLRLLQEDAAKPKMRVALPEGAIAFDFGTPGAVVPGFKNVSAATKYDVKLGYGFTDDSQRVNGGEGWPDLLTGTFVSVPSGQRMKFQATVPEGEYYVWFNAGMIVRHDLKEPHFYLKLGGQALISERPDAKELHGSRYLHRYLAIDYSERPHALWEDYIASMYGLWGNKVHTINGKVTFEAENFFVGALILVPVEKKEAFIELTKNLEATRIKSFEDTFVPFARPKVDPPPPGKDYTFWTPHALRQVRPWSRPGKEETSLPKVTAAPGQRVAVQLALTPHTKKYETAIVRHREGWLPDASLEIYTQEYRSDGSRVEERCLLRNPLLKLEPELTRSFWLWLHIPENAKPGTHHVKLELDFEDRSTAHTLIPFEIAIQVLPIALRDDLPLSLGMYFSEPQNPPFPAARRREGLKELLTWMRAIGFTGVAVPPPTLTGLKGDGTTSLRFDPTLYELAREVGMGARPEQYSMGSVLGLGRAIGRRLPGSQGAKVDQEPGIELRQPKHKEYFLDALTQYRDFIEKSKLPVAVEIVDEPREVPNPWNRNLADTLTYAEYLNAVPRLKGFVTPMSDSNGGKDYTVLADHVPIVSVHAWKASAGLMKRTREKNRTLWLYNTGMDRFSWGFYNWRVGSAGRWEWHFCWPEDQAVGGYPGREWYNPFTSMHGLAPQAPWPTYRGGITFHSAFFQVAEGINDARYLFTLEEILKECKKTGKHEKTIAEAEAFLADIRKSIPEFPSLHGLSGEGDGALIGQGIKDSAAAKAGEWRAKIADLLVNLMR